MKTVSGVVVSSKPVSLFKAAKILSKFLAADNGATPSYAHYLKRTSASFDELVQLHKELQGTGSKSRSKKNRSGTTQSEAEELVSSGHNHLKDDEVEENYVEIPNEIKEPKNKKRTNTVDNGVEQRIHENLDPVENGKKRDKEAKKARKHVVEEGGSNGVQDGVRVQNNAKNVVDDGVEQRFNEKSDLVEDDMGGTKREKEAKKQKKHGVSKGVGIENDAKNVVDNGIEQRIHGKLDTVEDGVGGKKRDKEPKKVKNRGVSSGVGIENDSKNVVDNSGAPRIHGKLDSVDSIIGGKKREKEAKKARNQVNADGGSNGVQDGVHVQNHPKKVVDDGVGQRIKGKLDLVEDDMGGTKKQKEAKKVKNHGVSKGVEIDNDAKNVVDNGIEDGVGGKKREKEPKKVKNRGVSSGVGIENDSKNVADSSVEPRINRKLDTVDSRKVGKKRDKEANKKARNQVTEDGASIGVFNEVGSENSKGKKRKMKDGSVAENREENKVSKKRKSEEITEAINGDVNGSAEKLMKHKKRKKNN